MLLLECDRCVDEPALSALAERSQLETHRGAACVSAALTENRVYSLRDRGRDRGSPERPAVRRREAFDHLRLPLVERPRAE